MIPARTMPIRPKASRPVPSRRRSTPSHSIAASYLARLRGRVPSEHLQGGLAWSGSRSSGWARWGRRWPPTSAAPASRSRSGTGRRAAPPTWSSSAPARRPRRPRWPAASDVVVCCVSDTPDVEAVLFGDEGVADGIAPGRPGHRLLDDLAVGHRRASPGASPSAGVAFVDAPVSGGSEGARKATLTIIVGGEPDDVRARPPGARGDGQDDHPVRARRQRPGRQGRQPGDPRRGLPRRRRGHRARHQGRPRPGGGRRGARRRRGAAAGSSRTAADA